MSLAALLTDIGNHVPVIPFDDVVGNIGAVSPAQIAGIGLNVGATAEFMVKSKGKVSEKQM